jgi:thiol-disulfide isomerase/thioredoxin
VTENTGTARRFWRGRWAVAAAVAVVLGVSAVLAQLDEAPVPGAPLAANLGFTLKDMHGADVRLADFRGRPIVLNFWATWCGPCRAEIPALNEMANRYKSDKLAIFGISVDDQPADLQKFTDQFAMNYPVLVGLGQDKLQETYDAAMFVPITWLIRPDGTIFLKHQGPATREWLETQIKSLVAGAAEPPA